MVAPGSTGASFDVLLQFSLDEAANKRVQDRTSTIEEELKRIQDQAKKTGKALQESMNNIDTQTGKVTTSVAKVGAELAKLGERSKTASKQVNEGLDSNIRKFKQLQEAAGKARQESALISGAAARAGSMFGQGLAVGGLVAGGILAEANRYARQAEEIGQATQATREWTRATEDLSKARARVDNVLLKEALPLLQQAAKVAEQAASFVERNPQIVRAALNAGVLIAGVSAIGLAVSKGIKLFADTAYIAAVATELIAAKLHKQAADQSLAAAAAMRVTNRADDLRQAFGLTPAPAARSLAGQTIQIAGAVTLIATSVLLGAEIGNTIGNAIAKLIDPNAKNMTLKETLFYGGVRAFEAITQKIQGAEKEFLQLLSLTEKGDQNIERIFGKANGLLQANDKFFQRLLLGLDQATEKADELANSTTPSAANSVNRDQLLQAYEDYKRDDLALVQEHYAERRGIVQDALAAELAANQQYANSVAKVNADTAKALAAAATDFARANARAEQQYVQQRAQIIRDGNAEIEQIEADSKERLRKLAQEHEDRVADLTNRRDALGLARENRDYGRSINDEKRQAQQEIRDRRQAIQQRLADLRQSYEAERAQRLADYQARVAEIRASAAERLKEMAAEHLEEIKRIREQKVAKLKEMDAQFVDERKRRYAYFVQQIRDLDATLIGERDRRLQYQQQMLADLDAWAAQYRAAALAAFPTGSPTARASGGYARDGLYRLGEQGREFVMSNASTRSAEKIIGGQLTQANLMAALSAVTAGRNATYVDQRRIDQPVSRWDKMAMRQAAEEALQGLIR